MLARLLLQTSHAMTATRIRPIGTATPMPIFAPVERPPLPEAGELGLGLAVDEAEGDGIKSVLVPEEDELELVLVTEDDVDVVRPTCPMVVRTLVPAFKVRVHWQPIWLLLQHQVFTAGHWFMAFPPPKLSISRKQETVSFVPNHSTSSPNTK